ncbi:divergent polysaccharide deacetylase family protein [Treponema socranskii]|uniref:divergent polysaccharide deacetylase family protein n=1 Tax=Treponema socranskii TaxID=53419 RepID=UPI003D8F4CA9
MAQNGRPRVRKTASHSSEKPSTRIKPASGRRAGKKHKIVFSSVQTAILCVVIVALCFAVLIVNSGRNPKNTAVENQIASQNADSAGDASGRTESRQNADLQSSKDPQQSSRSSSRRKAESSDAVQSAENLDVRQSSGRETRSSEESKKNTAAGTSTERERVVEAQVHRSAGKNSSENAKPSSSSPKGQPANPPSVKPLSSVKPSPSASVSPAVPASQLLDIPQAVNGAKLVFVFDDAGQSLSQLEKFVSLPFPITVSVLPKLAHSKACADKVRASGNEVMLHQPMQAVNLNVNPGPGAVTADMQTSSIEALIKENIAEIGPVAGINNHEGSLISEDEMKIGAAMLAAKESGVFFLDSRTTSQTRVPQAAMALGIPYYSRNVFLDNTKDREKIIRELMRGVGIANANGAAIMIGHIWSADILPGILIEFYPALKNKGYVFTTVSNSDALIRP